MATTIVNNFINPGTPFELIVNTNNTSANTTANNQFNLLHASSGFFNYQISWGDGTVENIVGEGNAVSPTHTYASIGIYSVKIRGIFAGVRFDAGEGIKVVQVVSPDRRNKQIQFDRMFRFCSNLTLFNFDDVSLGTLFFQSWRGTAIITFPPVKFVNMTGLNGAWSLCAQLTTFPAGAFDNWIGNPALNCFNSTWIGCSSLTTQSVENILVSIDTSGKSAPAGATGTHADITIDYNIATGGLTTATNTAITNLKAKGWTPRINGIYV